MVIARISPADFEEMAATADGILELIGGEVVEVPSNAYASQISARISGYIFMYLLENDIGHLTGEAGGYVVGGDRYAPDVAFISKAKQPELAKEGYNPNPPDLAVEVDFPSTVASASQLRVKVINYLRVGTVVWVVRPERREIEVYAPDEPVTFFGINDTLTGGDVLPGLEITVADVFPAENETSQNNR